MTPGEFMREYEAATRAHDLERKLGLIDENALYWFSDGASYSGKEAIARAAVQLRGDRGRGLPDRGSDLARRVPRMGGLYVPLRVVRHRRRLEDFRFWPGHISAGPPGRVVGRSPRAPEQRTGCLAGRAGIEWLVELPPQRTGSHIGNEDVDEKKQNGKEDKEQEQENHTLR